ncbi:MAG: DUF86 domain-containing protein [Cyanobacteria bacterium J06621_8]
MSKNRDLASIIDIYQAGTKIINFAQNLTQESLVSDEMRLSAILYQILIMGEATKRLSLEFRQANSHLPWKEIAGIRDKLIHDYDNIKPDVIWDVVNREIPEFLPQLEELLPKSSSE